MDFFYRLFKLILPEQIKIRLKEELRNWLLARRKKNDQVPSPDLQEIHITSIKTLINRSKLLEALPKGGTIAEIGVAKGKFSEEILKIAQPLRLHLVDVWDSERYGKAMKQEVEAKFEAAIKSGIIQIHEGLSIQIGQTFPDDYFDWVYLDTDHSYETTKAELELFSKKVKRSGCIAGHDFVSGNFEKGIRYGVMEAVYEFCVQHHWRIIFLTMEIDEHPSFAIQRIED